MLDNRKLWKYYMISKFLLVLFTFGVVCADDFRETLQEIQIVNYTAYPTFIVFWSEIEDLNLSWVKCDDIKARLEGGSFFCENLEPCTEYVVTYKTQTEYATFNGSFPVKTTFFKPQVLLDNHNIIPNNDSIFMLWGATFPQCISRLSIHINSTDFLFDKNITDNHHLDVTNLNPCQEYGIYIKVFDIHENLIKEDLLTATTSYSDPGKINSIETVKGENNTVTVKWTSPKHKNCVQFYYIKWTKLQCILNKPDCIWSQYNHTDPVNLSFTFENLEGCTQYALIITPNGDQLTNASVNHNFTSSEQIPGKVVDLKIKILYPRKVTISWKLPEHNSSCIKIYKINLFGNGIEVPKETPDLEVTFTDLEPCATYNVTVIAVTFKNNTGKPNSILITMEDHTPSQVHNVTVRYYPMELSVFWKEPIDAKYCVRHYRIAGWATYEPGNSDYKFDNKTTAIRTTIKELIPCMMYTIQIIAVTTSQLEGLPYTLDAETLPMVSQPPREPEASSVTKDSIEIKTTDVNDKNKCPILYAKFTCEAAESGARIPYAEETVVGNLITFSAVLKPLSPYTKYLCRAYLFNTAGDWSTDSKALLSTGEYFPEVPQSVSAIPTSNTSIIVTWSPPKFPNGKILLYNVYIQTIGPKYKIPAHCTQIKWDNISLPIDGKLEHTFQDGLPYMEYSVQVVAKNSYGLGMFSTPVTVVTDPWIPRPVEEFSVKSIDGPGLSDKYEASVHLTWKLPCRSNGLIKGFRGTFKGIREGHKDQEFSWEVFIKNPLIENKEQFDWRESKLKPEFNYTVEIKALLENDDLESDIRIVNFVSPAGIPQRVNITGKGDVNAFAASNPTTSAVVSFPLKMFHSDMGGILYAALLLSQKDCQPDPAPQFNKIDSVHDWPVVPTWYEVQNQDCVSQYQTTPIRWDPLNDYKYRSLADGNVEFAIGVDDCDGKATYCNGPLKADTKYKLTIRLFTRSGYNDAATLEFKTDSLVKLYFILLLVVSCLLLAFMLGFIYLWITKRIIWHRESLLGIDEQSGDVSAKNFLVHYEELSKYEKLQREFKELTVITNDLNLTNTASKSNESKNRYSNIFPYDKNRVILDCDSDGADYINASFINGYKHKKEFIATQGPKPESFIDFWKMILQHNVRIIVMVTQLREGDIIKCHQYYPQLSKEMRFGTNITVTCRKELQQELYDRREMQVEHCGDGLVQKVVHYYFKKWPDHDVPADPNDLITFIRKIKCERIPNHSPIVVHCSAGVGRTGTFIGLDILMQRLKSEGKINIFETVKELRFQRMRMVQTIQQYQFLYSCAHHLVKKKFPSKSKNRVRDDEIQLHLNNQNNSGSNQSFSPNDIESVT